MAARSTNQATGGDRLEAQENLSPGLYVHVPFCASRCTYCDFHVASLRIPVVRDYVEALVDEISIHFANGFQPRTIFIGGGTPSALDLASWDKLLATLSKYFKTDLIEWTVEMNPESIDAKKIEIALSHGVDRISTGAQTFDERGLSLMGRRHDASRVFEVHQLMAELGVPRTSLDLIVGWPGQDLESVKADLEAVAAIDPDHVSLYHLSYEQGTWLDAMRRRGVIDPLLDETCIELSRQFLEGLSRQGYRRYEVSNLYKRGGESLHNLNYWLRGTYLGAGSGAASFHGGKRWKNRPDVQSYIASGGKPERVDVERPGGFTVVIEQIMLGLRLVEGIDPAQICSETGYDIFDRCGSYLRRYEQQGFLLCSENSIRLTDRGFEILDTMIVEMLELLERTGDASDLAKSSGSGDCDPGLAASVLGSR
jgi:oxygen-independent coproporphyrinogen-3 oxidase